MIYGYARISANDSDFKIQHKALTAALCDDIFIDTAPSDENLNKMISATVSGDSVIVWRLDKLATSATQLSVRVRHLNDKGVSFITLREGEKVLVKESADEIVERAIKYARSIRLFPDLM